MRCEIAPTRTDFSAQVAGISNLSTHPKNPVLFLPIPHIEEIIYDAIAHIPQNAIRNHQLKLDCHDLLQSLYCFDVSIGSCLQNQINGIPSSIPNLCVTRCNTNLPQSLLKVGTHPIPSPSLQTQLRLIRTLNSIRI